MPETRAGAGWLAPSRLPTRMVLAAAMPKGREMNANTHSVSTIVCASTSAVPAQRADRLPTGHVLSKARACMHRRTAPGARLPLRCMLQDQLLWTISAVVGRLALSGVTARGQGP